MKCWAIGGSASVLAIVVAFAVGMRAGASTKPREDAWEYAMYAISGDGHDLWYAPGLEIDEADGSKFTQRIGGKAIKDPTYLDIMNAAGTQGWEFCRYEDGEHTAIYFKRRAH